EVVEHYEDLVLTLDDLALHPEAWRAKGQQGQAHVRREFGSETTFLGRITDAIEGLAVPLAERMRRRGLERAAALDRPAWRDKFAVLIDHLLHRPARDFRECVEVHPRLPARTVAADLKQDMVPIPVVNRGTHPVAADGPGRWRLRCQVRDGQDVGDADSPGCTASLPGLLIPGKALPAAMPVPVPSTPGVYEVTFWAEPVSRKGQSAGHEQPALGKLRLIVEGTASAAVGTDPPAFHEGLQAALVEAERLHQLPDDYTDVTEGLLAGVKRRIKRKLLGNFKTAYVDVLSRQQSAFN